MQRSLLFTCEAKATAKDKVITAERVEFQVNAKKKSKQNNLPKKQMTKDQDGPFKSWMGLISGQH